MAPRSWRPDSSLADTIPVDTVEADTKVDLGMDVPPPMDIEDQPSSLLHPVENTSNNTRTEDRVMSSLSNRLRFDDNLQQR